MTSGTLPGAWITSLNLDANMVTSVIVYTLRLLGSPVKSQRKVAQKDRPTSQTIYACVGGRVSVPSLDPNSRNHNFAEKPMNFHKIDRLLLNACKPLFTQEREVSANLRCLKFSACSSNRQPTAASIFKCGKSLANVQFRELFETGAGYRVISKC